MKSTTTLFFINKLFYCSVFLIGLGSLVQAQQSHDISVTDFEFTPSNLEINVGDTVTWTNFGGVHNVNGTTSVFPDNPTGFGNGVPDQDWVFSHAFSIPGVYEYRCDVHWDGMGMGGVITVSGETAVSDHSRINEIPLMPNPAKDVTSLDLSALNTTDLANSILMIYSIQGSLLKTIPVNGNDRVRLSLEEMPAGVLILEIVNENKNLHRAKLIKL